MRTDESGNDGVRDDQLDQAPAKAWAPMLATLVELVQAVFMRRGRSIDQARLEARAVVVEMAKYFGGRVWYMPRGERLHNALRDIEIAGRMGVERPEALAEEFGLSITRIYKISSQQRSIRREQRNRSILEEL